MTILIGVTTLTGTAGDDIIAGTPSGGASNSILGNGGDDLILADSDHVVLGPALGHNPFVA